MARTEEYNSKKLLVTRKLQLKTDHVSDDEIAGVVAFIKEAQKSLDREGGSFYDGIDIVIETFEMKRSKTQDEETN